MNIQWYPGHMTKARRMIEDQLKLVDLVVEIVDARLPASSRNPEFDPLFKNHARVVVLNKADLADKAITREWIDYYRAQGWLAMHAQSTNRRDLRAFYELCQKAAQQKVERWAQRGAKKIVRAMVVGIPNVGKSTFINTLSGSARAATADRPGVTRGRQWVSVGTHLELMDTPGLLWPKQEDPEAARRLAYVGSINDQILDQEELCSYLLADLAKLKPQALRDRFKLEDLDLPGHALLDACCQKRGFLRAGGVLDTDRGAKVILDEFRAGKLGAITLERPVSIPAEEEKTDGED